MELRGWGNAKIFVREFLSLIHVKVDIYFTAAGLFYIPAEQRLIDTMQILKQKNAEKSNATQKYEDAQKSGTSGTTAAEDSKKTTEKEK